MKLVKFEHQTAYQFILTFANGEVREVDLKSLISNHVNLESLETARINQEWGCLEFKEGKVDIEPKTLYKYAMEHLASGKNDSENISQVSQIAG
jgi:hypothetical protein